MKCTVCGTNIADGGIKCPNCEFPVITRGNANLQLHGMSIRKLVILFVCTFGLYSMVWFARNWGIVQKHEKLNIIPGARGFFSIFFAHGLFRRIMATATANDYKTKYDGDYLGNTYVVLVVLGNIDRFSKVFPFISIITLGLFFAILWPLIEAQRAINYSNGRITSDFVPNNTYSLGTKVFAGLFGLYALLCYVAIVYYAIYPDVEVGASALTVPRSECENAAQTVVTNINYGMATYATSTRDLPKLSVYGATSILYSTVASNTPIVLIQNINEKMQKTETTYYFDATFDRVAAISDVAYHFTGSRGSTEAPEIASTTQDIFYLDSGNVLCAWSRDGVSSPLDDHVRDRVKTLLFRRRD